MYYCCFVKFFTLFCLYYNLRNPFEKALETIFQFIQQQFFSFSFLSRLLSFDSIVYGCNMIVSDSYPLFYMVHNKMRTKHSFFLSVSRFFFLHSFDMFVVRFWSFNLILLLRCSHHNQIISHIIVQVESVWFHLPFKRANNR